MALTSGAIAAALKDFEDDEPAAALALPGLHPALPPAPAPRAVDDEIDGGDEAPPLAIAAPRDVPREVSVGGDSGSEEIDGEGRGPLARTPDELVPAFIEGVATKLKKRTRDEQAGILVECPVHEGCSCYRSLRLDTAFFGPRAAVFFCGAWLRGASVRDVASHHRWRPSRDEVRAYKESL